MPLQSTDVYGHKVTQGGTQLTAGAVGTSAAGTISAQATAGSTATITITDCTDQRGSFLINSSGTGQGAGEACSVRFAKEYPAPPIVVVNLSNETDGTSTITYSAVDVTTAGFDIEVGTVNPASGKSYRVNYIVLPGGTGVGV